MGGGMEMFLFLFAFLSGSGSTKFTVARRERASARAVQGCGAGLDGHGAAPGRAHPSKRERLHRQLARRVHVRQQPQNLHPARPLPPRPRPQQQQLKVVLVGGHGVGAGVHGRGDAGPEKEDKERSCAKGPREGPQVGPKEGLER